MNDFVKKVQQQTVNPSFTEISSPEEWVAAAVLKIKPNFAKTIYNFFCVRQNNPFYPKRQELVYSIIELEQEYLRFIYLNEVDPASSKEQSLFSLLRGLSADASGQFQEFMTANLIEYFNIRARTGQDVLSEQTILLKFIHDNGLHGLLSSFNFLKETQESFSNSPVVNQKLFLDTIFLFSFDLLIAHHQNLLFFFIKNSNYRQVVQECFFLESEKNLEIVFNQKYFFLESEFIYPFGDQAKIEKFLYVYGKLNNECYLDCWTPAVFIFLNNAVVNHPGLPENSLRKVFNLVRNYYLKINNSEINAGESVKPMNSFLINYFDRHVMPELNANELYLLKNVPHEEYYLYSNWVSETPADHFSLSGVDPTVSFKNNLKKLFGLTSPQFQKDFLSNFYNKNFYYLNKSFFFLGVLSHIFSDKNYLKQMYSHFLKKTSLADASYYSVFKNHYFNGNFDNLLYESFEFIKTQYSEKRLLNLFLKADNFFLLIDTIADIKQGYDSLLEAAKHLNLDEPETITGLPKKIKNFEELHTWVYLKLSILENEKVSLYDSQNPIWVIDGVQTIDQNLAFVVPKDSWELKYFASFMNNCVGGYVNKIIKSESIIVTVFLNKKPYICIEIKNYKINEIKHPNNQAVSDLDLERIKYFLINSGLITN